MIKYITRPDVDMIQQQLVKLVPFRSPDIITSADCDHVRITIFGKTGSPVLSCRDIDRVARFLTKDPVRLLIYPDHCVDEVYASIALQVLATDLRPELFITEPYEI